MTVQEAPPREAPPQQPRPIGRCPQCGNPYESGQLACLTCAAPLGLSRPPRPGRRRALATGLAVVLLLGGVAAGYGASVLGDDDETTQARNPAPPRVAPPPPPPPPTTPPEETNPPPGTGEPTSPGDQQGATPGDATPGSGAGGGTPSSWPSGKDAHTVVLKSTKQRSEADSRAREAAKAGIPAGVLRSDDYKGLRRGWWVVFAGQFSSQREALRRQRTYRRKGFPGYVRYVDAR